MYASLSLNFLYPLFLKTFSYILLQIDI